MEEEKLMSLREFNFFRREKERGRWRVQLLHLIVGLRIAMPI